MKMLQKIKHMARCVLTRLLVLQLGLSFTSGYAEQRNLIRLPSEAQRAPLPDRLERDQGYSSTDKKALPEAEKKSTWFRAKKHLKRYWRRYALAAAALLITADQLHTRQAKKTPSQALSISTELSPLERFVAHQYQLILRVIALFSGKPLQRLQQRFIVLKNRYQSDLKNRLDRIAGRPFNASITEMFDLPKGARVRSIVDSKDTLIISGKAESLVYDFFEGSRPAPKIKLLQLITMDKANYGKTLGYAVDAAGQSYIWVGNFKGSKLYRRQPPQCNFMEHVDIIGFDEEKRPLYSAGRRRVDGISFEGTSLLEQRRDFNAPPPAKMPKAVYNRFGRKIVQHYDRQGRYLGIPSYEEDFWPQIPGGGISPALRSPAIRALQKAFYLHPAGTQIDDGHKKWCMLGHCIAFTRSGFAPNQRTEKKILQHIVDVLDDQINFGLSMRRVAVDMKGVLYISPVSMEYSGERVYQAYPGASQGVFPIGYDKTQRPLYSKNFYVSSRGGRYYNTTADITEHSDKEVTERDPNMPVTVYDKNGNIISKNQIMSLDRGKEIFIGVSEGFVHG